MMELGIEILSQPATISVDFVFIHGLDGDRTRTWTSEKMSEIWPQALLPRDFPHARILSWGYQSSLFQANSRDSITQRSLGLLRDLRSVRYHTGTENVELVFVCHSLGGLICKQMLIDSRNGPYIKDRAIYDLTVGIVFLGTPHAPSSPLLLDSIRAILKATAIDGSETFIRPLSFRSEELGRLQESFESLLKSKNQYGRPILTASFVETEHSVMPEKSAILQGQSPSLLPGNHSSMVKFGRPTDPGYEKICTTLKELLEAYRAPSTIPSENISSELIGRCARSLWFPEIELQEVAVPTVAAGTCDWIFQHVNYQRWDFADVENDSESVLWIKGSPGSGKSTLTKHILAKLRESHAYCLSFFFSSKGSYLQRSSVGCYRSLLSQMLLELPECRGTLIRKFQEKENSNVSGENIQWSWSLLELSQIFHTAIREVQYGENVYIVIDGLDECEPDERHSLEKGLLESSESWVRLGKDIKICFSSRHYPTIAARDYLEIVLESSNEPDIEEYLTANLPPEAKSEAGQLARRSHGNFLWAVLVCKEIRKILQYDTLTGSTINPGSVLKFIDDIPVGIKKFYLQKLSSKRELWSQIDIGLLQCISRYLLFNPGSLLSCFSSSI